MRLAGRPSPQPKEVGSEQLTHESQAFGVAVTHNKYYFGAKPRVPLRASQAGFKRANAKR
jgi:hypothetical protein